MTDLPWLKNVQYITSFYQTVCTEPKESSGFMWSQSTNWANWKKILFQLHHCRVLLWTSVLILKIFTYGRPYEKESECLINLPCRYLKGKSPGDHIENQKCENCCGIQWTSCTFGLNMLKWPWMCITLKIAPKVYTIPFWQRTEQKAPNNQK